MFRVRARCGGLVNGGAVNRTRFGTVSDHGHGCPRPPGGPPGRPARARGDRHRAPFERSLPGCGAGAPALSDPRPRALLRRRDGASAGAHRQLVGHPAAPRPCLGPDAGRLAHARRRARRRRRDRRDRDHQRLSRDAGRRRRRRHRRGGLPSGGRALRPAGRRLGGVDGHGPLLGRRQCRLRRRPGRRHGRRRRVRASRHAPRGGDPGPLGAPSVVGPAAARGCRRLGPGGRPDGEGCRGRRVGRVHRPLRHGRRPHGGGLRPARVRPHLVRARAGRVARRPGPRR